MDKAYVKLLISIKIEGRVFMVNSILWLILMAVLLLLEIMTLRMIAIWFAVGSLAAFLITSMSENLIMQAIAFFLMSLALLIFVRPLMVKYMKPRRKKINGHNMIGKQATVVVTIDNHRATGKVFMDGKEWLAKSLDGTVIHRDTRVKVQGISGINLIVEKIYGYREGIDKLKRYG